MGNRKDFPGEAEFREPSRAWTVIEGGSGQDRRPGPPGASPEEEAYHEVPARPAESHRSVRPENPTQADRGPEDREGPVPSGFRLLPPQGHDAAQGDHQADRRSVDARRARKRQMASPTVAEPQVFGKGADTPTPAPHGGRSRVVYFPTITIEETPATAEEQHLMNETVRLVARWLCRYHGRHSSTERKAA